MLHEPPTSFDLLDCRLCHLLCAQGHEIFMNGEPWCTVHRRTLVELNIPDAPTYPREGVEDIAKALPKRRVDQLIEAHAPLVVVLADFVKLARQCPLNGRIKHVAAEVCRVGPGELLECDLLTLLSSEVKQGAREYELVALGHVPVLRDQAKLVVRPAAQDMI